MDVSKLHDTGFMHRVELREGIALAYADFQKKHVSQSITDAHKV
jgi:GDP-L-fucose synthase